MSRTLDALRQHNGTSPNESASRRNSAEENVLASLGYPTPLGGPRRGPSVLRVLLGIALVVVTGALLYQVAAMNGLVPKGKLASLFGGAAPAARTASSTPPLSRQTPPPQAQAQAQAQAAAPQVVPPTPASAAPAPAVPVTAAPAATPAPAARKAEAPRTAEARPRAARPPKPAPVRQAPPEPVVTVPPAAQAVRSGPAPSAAGSGVMPRGATQVPGVYRTETGEVDHFKLALYYHRIGDFENALVQYRAVLEVNELNAEAHNNLGLLYLDKTLYEESIREFRRATFIDPRYTKARNNLGLALLKSGKTDAAVTEFRAVVAQEPRNVEGLSNLALGLKSASRLEEAREVLLRTLSLSAKYPPAHYNLALIYEETGDLMRAIQHYETFLSASGADNATLAADVRARVSTLKAKLL